MRGPPIVTLAAGAIPNGHSVRGAVVVLKRSIRGPTETYEASRGCTGRTAGPGPGRCRDRDQLARCPGARAWRSRTPHRPLQRHQPVIVILRDAVRDLRAVALLYGRERSSTRQSLQTGRPAWCSRRPPSFMQACGRWRSSCPRKARANPRGTHAGRADHLLLLDPLADG
jgi:hypothetical protein